MTNEQKQIEEIRARHESDEESMSKLPGVYFGERAIEHKHREILLSILNNREKELNSAILLGRAAVQQGELIERELTEAREAAEEMRDRLAHIVIGDSAHNAEVRRAEWIKANAALPWEGK